MATPTVPVTVTLAAQDGTPYEGVTVRARLDKNDVYESIVISDQAEGVTDADGVAVLDLFPNAPSPEGLGTQGTTYRFAATISGGRSLNVRARVPNEACRLENILVDSEAVTLSAAELALMQAQSAVTTAATSAAAAEEDAQQTALDRVATGGDRDATAADALATAGDRAQTAEDRIATAADRVQTGEDRVAAAASASAAASSEAGAAAIVQGNFRQDGAGSEDRPFLDKNRDAYSSMDKMTALQVIDVRTGADTLNVAGAIQAAQDDVPSGVYKIIDLGDGLSRAQASSASPFYFGNQASNPTYPAVLLDKSNVTYKGGRLHIVSRASVAAGDVQPAFATAKNETVGTLENITFDGVEFDTENNADATNSNQRCLYLTGIRGVRLLNTVGESTGTRRGYFAHIQNCEDIQIIGHRHYNMTGGINIRYCDRFLIDDFLFNNFSEAIDLDGTSKNGIIKNGHFTSSARTNQCLDINGQVGLKAGNFTVYNVGNIATIQYKHTTAPTFAEYLEYSTWKASEPYIVGDKCINGSTFYECVTAGTSAASGGPTGTGSGIADGTAEWDYIASPFAMTPSQDVTIRGVRGSAVGATTTASFLIGNDTAHEGSDPVFNITLEDIQLSDVGQIFAYEARNLLLRDVHLKDVLVPSGFTAIDLRSATSTDVTMAWSDLTVRIENCSVEESDYGAMKIAAARRVVIDGLRVRLSNRVSGSDPDLRINSMETRGAEVFVDGLDLDGSVILQGDSTAVATWAASTAYPKNKIVKNGSNFYRATVGGTSAGSGGPTGTTSGITDNTVTWEYLPSPFRVVWGPNNKVRGTFTMQSDVHKYIHGRTLALECGDIAATGTVSRMLFVAKRRCYVARATYAVAAAVAADATNYRAITIKSIQSGAAATSIAQVNTTLGWSAYTEIDGAFAVSEAGAILNPGDVVFMDLTSASSGKALTGLMVQLEVLDL